MVSTSRIISRERSWPAGFSVAPWVVSVTSVLEAGLGELRAVNDALGVEEHVAGEEDAAVLVHDLEAGRGVGGSNRRSER